MTECKFCNGNGVSEISDPCICRYSAEIERVSTLCDKWNSECDEYREENRRQDERIRALEKQRDELLKALEKVTAKLAWLNSDDCGHIMALTDESEALIASVKEKA